MHSGGGPMTRRVFIPPLQAMTPVHTFCGALIPLADAQAADDTHALTEWLGGKPITVVRMRTARFMPVPWPRTDWDALEQMLAGGAA